MTRRSARLAGVMASIVALALAIGIGVSASGGTVTPQPTFDPNKNAKPCSTPLAIPTQAPPQGGGPVADCYIPVVPAPDLPADPNGQKGSIA